MTRSSHARRSRPARRRRRARPGRDRHRRGDAASPPPCSTSASATAPAGSACSSASAASAERRLRPARLGRAARPAIATVSLLDRAVRHVLGHLPAHRQRPRRRAAGQPRPLLHPRRPVRHLHRRLPRDGAAARSGPSAVAVRIGRDWCAPLGGVLICACGAFSLIGFPLDDVWHRLFGQDVTLWGPTHLMLIGGAAMTLVGIAVLHRRGPARERAPAATPRRARASTRLARAIALTGGLLIGLSTFQAEFDFGVPQFRLIFQPMLIDARRRRRARRSPASRRPRRGARRGRLLPRHARRRWRCSSARCSGETTPHFPLYIAEALVVEAVALRRRPTSAPLRFGALRRARDRHRRPRRRVGLVARLDAAALARGAVPRRRARSASPRRSPAALIGAWIGARLAVEPGSRAAAAARGRGRRAPRCSRRWSASASTRRADEGVERARRPAPTSARLRRPRGRRPTVDLNPRRRGRRRRVVRRHRLAGRRPRRRPLERVGARPLPHHRADPGPRQLEDDDPPAPRQLADRAADLPAARRGDPGRRSPGPGRASPAPSATSTSCSSASRRAAARSLVALAYSVVARRSRSACSRCSPGACTGSPSACAPRRGAGASAAPPRGARQKAGVGP